MQPSPGSRTLVVTVGGATTVTIQMGSGGFTAFGASWAYNATTDRYESSIGWIAFDASPNTFSANWGAGQFGGTWS